MKDAEALTGVQYDISNLGDVYNAIHAIQEELGITGTTAKEAEKTITGSANMMKAAWENVLVTIAGGGNWDVAINNLVYSIEKYFENIVPVVERSLIGIGTLIERVAPTLVQNVASALIQSIPSLLNAVYRMIIGLAKGIKQGIIALFSGQTGTTQAIINSGSSMGDVFDNVTDSTEESADNIYDISDALDKAEKEAKKSLAAFDDLQILTSQKEEQPEFEFSLPEDSVVDSSQNQQQTTPSLLSPVLDTIKADILAFLPFIEIGLVVVGLLLIAFGQIGWGIGFIIAGAYLYTVRERSGEKGFDFSIIQQDLSAILPYIDDALVAIGLLLMFLGQIPIGIGFIIAGAIVYGAEEVFTEDYAGEDVITKLAVIAEAVALALVAIGIILIFFGNFPLGLGFIVAGKKLLDVAEQELNEGEVTTKIQKFFEDNKAIFVGVSAALVVLGICLLFVPGALPIALGLIFSGAGILATEASINMEEIPNMVSEFISKNLALIEGVSTALVVLGIILLFTGVGAPLGIGMIIAGGVGLLADEVFFNWDFIVEKIKTTWEKIKAFWRGDIAPVFSEQWWNILAITCINGLIAGFEGGINLIIIIFENMINVIISGLNKISFNIPDWLGGGHFGLNLSPVSLERVSFGRIPLPSAATGSFVPNSSIPQRNFTNSYTDKTMATTMDGDYSAPRNLKTEVVLEVDGREFGRAVVEQGGIESRRIGTRLVMK